MIFFSRSEDGQAAQYRRRDFWKLETNTQRKERQRMTRKEFYDYLLEFLSLEDVQKLEAYGIECAEYAHEGIEIDNDDIEYIGREFVLDQIQIGELTFDDLEKIFQRKISEEERHNMEWRF